MADETAVRSLVEQTGNLSVTCAGSQADASCDGIAYHHRRTRSA